MEDAILGSYVFRHVIVDRAMVQLYIRGTLVELRGQAADERERDLIVNTVAKLVAPLKVDNRLFVDSAHRRGSDRWLAARIRSHLGMFAGLEPATLQVAVSSTGIRLTGTARSAEQRELTERYVAALRAQREVRNELTIAPDLPATSVKVDDASILAMLHQVLQMMPATQGEPHELACRDGEVTINGAVATAAEAELVSRLAGTVRGVKGVVNRLRVGS